MDFDKSSSSIVLDLAWGEVDTKKQDFIYAKDFPALIKNVEQILSGSQQLPLELLSNTGKNVIDTFAKEKEFFKIYRDEFKEIFHGLVGRTFKDTIEGTGTKLSNDILVNGEKDELEAEVPVTTEDVTPKTSPRKINRLLKNLEIRVEAMKEELKFKEEILAEKDRELVQLTRKLGDYKDRYDFVQRQFNFYKDHGESPRRSSFVTGEDQSKIAQQSTSTKHEFIISELKRKLHEQTMAISNLKEQLQRGEGSGILYRSYPEKGCRNPLKIGGSMILLLSILILLTLFSLIGLLIWLMGNDENSNASRFSWWETNGLLSRIGWFFHDWSDTSDMAYMNFEPSSDAYDRIMGIRHI